MKIAFVYVNREKLLQYCTKVLRFSRTYLKTLSTCLRQIVSPYDNRTGCFYKIHKCS